MRGHVLLAKLVARLVRAAAAGAVAGAKVGARSAVQREVDALGREVDDLRARMEAALARAGRGR